MFQAIAATKIYKVVQADGTVIYTDKPSPGAKEFQFKSKPNVVSPVQPTNKTGKRVFTATPATVPQQAPTRNYQLTIKSPANDATIRNNEGKVSINASLNPISNGVYELYLNGELYQKGNAPQFHLIDLNRGEYRIQMRFLDQTGKILASSSVSKFYLQKVSALLRPN